METQQRLTARCIPEGMERLCERLRGLVNECLSDHLYTSAAFYADKLVTLSNGAPGDVYLLAEVTIYFWAKFRP